MGSLGARLVQPVTGTVVVALPQVVTSVAFFAARPDDESRLARQPLIQRQRTFAADATGAIAIPMATAASATAVF